MRKQPIQETDIQATKNRLSTTDFIANDIIISDSLDKLPLPDGPRRMTFIVVAMCTNGTVSMSIDTNNVQIQKGDLVIISERHVIDNYQASPDAEGQLMIMSTRFFYDVVHDVSDLSSLFILSKRQPLLSLDSRESEIFAEYYTLLKRKVADTDNTYRRSIVGSIVHTMFYELCDVVAKRQQAANCHNTRSSMVFTKFISLLEINHKRERRVGWYATQMCITPKHLSETVKAVSMRTPNEWIDSYVTLAARLLLKNTTKSIKEIATELNFPNQSFLGKYFKEHVGMSPSQYRNS